MLIDFTIRQTGGRGVSAFIFLALPWQIFPHENEEWKTSSISFMWK